MSKNRLISGKIITGYLERFPRTASKTLARKIYNENKAAFSSIEAVRSGVRYYRGMHGQKRRSELADRRFILPAPTKGNPYSLPQTDAKEYVPYHIPSELKNGLIIADTHVPYHDTYAITLTLQYVKENADIDFLLINGDFMDAYQLSRFVKDPRQRHFVEELKVAEHMIAALRQQFPDAKIVYKEGNHDQRLDDYLKVKAPELFGLEEVELRNLLHLADYGIDYVGEKRIVMCGKLPIIHGHEMWTTLTNPVNPARGLFLKAKHTSLCAHHHQVSMHNEDDIMGSQTACWSMGCLCELTPQYMPINKWGHGFVLITKEPDGEFELENKRIWNGKVI